MSPKEKFKAKTKKLIETNDIETSIDIINEMVILAEKYIKGVEA